MIEPSKVKQVIIIRRKFPRLDGTEFSMQHGKAIAQGAHASISFLTERVKCFFFPRPGGEALDVRLFMSAAERQWLNEGFTKVVVKVDTEAELRAFHTLAKHAGIEAHLIEDEGLTQFKGELTATALAIGPDYSEKIDPITGHLPLL